MNQKPFLYGIKTKYKETVHTSELGVSRCKEFSRKIGWIPRDLKPPDDVGLDLLIETAEEVRNENYHPSGNMIGIQVKTGNSYFYRNKFDNEYFILSSSDSHKKNWDYWVLHPLPIYIFFYNDDNDYCSFFNVDDWKNSPDLWEKDEPLPIKSYNINKFQELLQNENLKETLKLDFSTSIKEKNVLFYTIDVLESIFYDDYRNYEKIYILLNHYKSQFSPALSLLFPHLISSKHDEIVELSLFALINWIDYNRWAPNIRDTVRSLGIRILNNLTLDHWKRILALVKDHDFYSNYRDNYKDSLFPGFDILCSLQFLDDYEEKFLKIAKDVTLPDYVRINALGLNLLGVSIRYNYIGIDTDYLTPEYPQFNEIFKEKRVRWKLAKNDLIELISRYYNVYFTELNNRKITAFL